MSVETRVVLLRHGESRAQADGFMSGHDTCTGLSDRGREQATALRQRLLSTGEFSDVTALYTSVLRRAIETADIIRPAIGEVVVKQDCDFCEIHPGEGEGLRWDEIDGRFPDWTETLRNPFMQRMPGGETWAEFYVRAGARLRRLAEDHPNERVLVVCHGGVIGASFVALGDVSMQMAAHVMTECVNTSVTEWRLDGSDWRLSRYNDHAHLAGSD